MRRKYYILALTIILVVGTVGCGVVGANAFSRVNGDDDSDGPTSIRRAATPLPPLASYAVPTAVPAEIIAQADAEELLLINLYERVNPSVVNLDIVVGDVGNQNFPLPDNPNPDRSRPPEEDFGPFNPRGQGSGFVYDTEGHIVTNSHVVEGAVAIFVTFSNGLELRAEVIGTDPDSDLAVIKVDAPENILLPVEWGDSEMLAVGQRAVAIGNPFGFQSSLTTGIISGLKRNLFSLNRNFRIPEVIQTDAAINPGNSGGPLLDSRGQVIGVNSAIVPRQVGFAERSFLGVGFAIPANLARRVIPSLIDQGYYDHPWIGIRAHDVTSEIVQEMNLTEAKGTLVVDVLLGTPASKAGLKGGNTIFTDRDGLITQIGGDVITAFGAEEINNFNDLISYLSRKGEIGVPTSMTIIRDGAEMEIEIVLDPRPKADQFSRP